MAKTVNLYPLAGVGKGVEERVGMLVIWYWFVVHLSLFSYDPDVTPANIFSNTAGIEKIPFVDKK